MRNSQLSKLPKRRVIEFAGRVDPIFRYNIGVIQKSPVTTLSSETITKSLLPL
jgi:hypothetical protein